MNTKYKLKYIILEYGAEPKKKIFKCRTQMFHLNLIIPWYKI